MSDLSLVVVGTITSQGIGKMQAPDYDAIAGMAKYIVPLGEEPNGGRFRLASLPRELAPQEPSCSEAAAAQMRALIVAFA